MNLYDYIYVDLEKSVSLYSQLTGGIVELRQTLTEHSSTSDNKRNYDFKIFKHNAGGDEKDSKQDTVTVKPHHALLQELEALLESSGNLLDLNKLEENQSLKSADIRNQLKNVLFVRATGRVVIEDYERLKKIASDFPDIIELINKSHISAIKESDTYKDIERQIFTLENSNGDKSSRVNNRRKANELKKELEKFTNSNHVQMVEQWILDGISNWIDAFLPNITSIRLYPFLNEIDEHIFGHLDASNFTVLDPTAFHFTYGSFPTEEFTMLGVITSVPDNQDDVFNPLKEFNKTTLNDDESLEQGFRGVFRAFEAIEAIIRTCRYPRVLVHPILVYRRTHK